MHTNTGYEPNAPNALDENHFQDDFQKLPPQRPPSPPTENPISSSSEIAIFTDFDHPQTSPKRFAPQGFTTSASADEDLERILAQMAQQPAEPTPIPPLEDTLTQLNASPPTNLTPDEELERMVQQNMAKERNDEFVSPSTMEALNWEDEVLELENGTQKRSRRAADNTQEVSTMEALEDKSLPQSSTKRPVPTSGNVTPRAVTPRTIAGGVAGAFAAGARMLGLTDQQENKDAAMISEETMQQLQGSTRPSEWSEWADRHSQFEETSPPKRHKMPAPSLEGYQVPIGASVDSTPDTYADMNSEEKKQAYRSLKDSLESKEEQLQATSNELEATKCHSQEIVEAMATTMEDNDAVRWKAANQAITNEKERLTLVEYNLHQNAEKQKAYMADQLQSRLQEAQDEGERDKQRTVQQMQQIENASRNGLIS